MRRYVNLLPNSLRRQQLTLRLLRRWLVACGCAAAVAGALWSGQQSALVELQKQVAEVDRDCTPIRAMARNNAASRLELVQLEKQICWLQSIEQAEAPLVSLAAVHQSAKRLFGDVQLDRIQFEGSETLLSANGDKKAPGAQTIQTSVPAPVSVNDRIELSGTALNDTAVSTFITELEDSGLFVDVELVSLQSQGSGARQFQVRCRIHTAVENLQVFAKGFTKDAVPPTSRIDGSAQRFTSDDGLPSFVLDHRHPSGDKL